MDRAVGELPVAEQVSSVFADVCRAELVGRTVKMAREVLNDSEVGAPGGIGEVTTLEFVEHHLSKMGHKNLLETRPYRPQRANGSVVAREASAASASFMGYYRRAVNSHEQTDLHRTLRWYRPHEEVDSR